MSRAVITILVSIFSAVSQAKYLSCDSAVVDSGTLTSEWIPLDPSNSNNQERLYYNLLVKFDAKTQIVQGVEISTRQGVYVRHFEKVLVGGVYQNVSVGKVEPRGNPTITQIQSCTGTPMNLNVQNNVLSWDCGPATFGGQMPFGARLRLQTKPMEFKIIGDATKSTHTTNLAVIKLTGPFAYPSPAAPARTLNLSCSLF